MLSNLGEPLRAEVELVAPEKGEQDSLAARLASPDAYSQANLPYPPSSLGLQVSVQKRASGEMYVSVVSGRPVPEPFLDLLLEVTWNGGRILRAYAALLDPPTFAGTDASAPSAPAPEVRPAPQAAPAPKVENIAAEPAPKAAAAAPAAAAPAAEPAADAAKAAPAESRENYGPVKGGDTLGRIARKVKPAELSLDQMMVLLFRANPDAFDGKNMNRLRRGKVLQVPGADQAGELSREAAHKEVMLQAGNFAAYRSKLAGMAANAPAQETRGPSAAGKVTAKAEDKAAPAVPPKEKLVLSPKAAGGKAAEEGAARKNELAEAHKRIEDLEKMVAGAKALGQQKGGAGAPASAVAKPGEALKLPAPPVKAVEAPKVAPVPAVAPKPAEPAKPVEPVKPAADRPGMEKPGMAVATQAASGSAMMAKSGTEGGMGAKSAVPAAATVAKSATRRKSVVVLPPPPPPSFMDEMMGQLPLLGGGAAALLGGGGLLAYRLRRKGGKAPARPGPESPAAAMEERKEPYTGTATDPALRAAVQAVGDEVDPVAEAEIYLAYGRDAQAEEILKDALKEPGQRPEVYLKLLEIFAKRKDAASFEPVAKELQGITRGEGEAWLHAAQMGFRIDPANPRYAAGRDAGTDFEHAATVTMAAAAPGEPNDDKLDFDIGTLAPGAAPGTATDLDLADLAGQVGGTTTDLDLGALPEQGAAPALDVTAQETARMDAMDFSLDLPLEGEPAAEPAPQAAAEESGNSLDFDLDLDALSPTPAEAKTVLDVGAHVDDGLDFDLEGLGGGAGPATAPVGTQTSGSAIPDLDLSTIALDMSGGQAGGGEAKDAHWHDVQTKFDLARAYQEMGDSEGAREILREVVTEGDAGQKAEAEKLLASLA